MAVVANSDPDAVVTMSQLDIFREAVKERLDSADQAGAAAAQEITALRSRVATLETKLAKATSTASTSLSSVQKELVSAVGALEDNWLAHNTCLAGFVKAGAVIDGAQGCPKPSGTTRCPDIKASPASPPRLPRGSVCWPHAARALAARRPGAARELPASCPVRRPGATRAPTGCCRCPLTMLLTMLLAAC